MKRFVILGAAAILASGSAGAQTLLQDTFAGENGGASQLNFASFTNWNVAGKVDMIGQGNPWGISCVGMCVDMDGTGGPGALVSKQNFAFSSGDVMKISLNVSGSQRGNALDDFYLHLNFGSNTTLGSFLGTGGFAGSGNIGNTAAYNTSNSLAGNAPFSIWSFQFEALQAGSVQYTIGTNSADNVGPVLDDVLIERAQTGTVVPEPATWAMIAFGLTGIGVAAKRRMRK
ncbi:MAG: PEP-CTERM sorting domain-containing protein [Gemmatimonas sp.]